MAAIPIHVDKETALDAAIDLLQGLRDGDLSAAEAAHALDELVDSGPWDDYDDAVFVGFAEAVSVLVPDGFDLWRAFDRDPAKIRERAAKAEARGQADKAARMRERADRVEARQAARG